MAIREPRPYPKCGRCGDWGTVVPRDGGKPLPCPDQCAASRKAQTAR